MVKTKTKNQKSRSSSVARARVQAKPVVVAQESDSIYILKLVLYLILGSVWVRVSKGSTQIPIPLGAIVGVFLARIDALQIDRKIEYAVLLLSMFIAFWLPLGIELIL